MSECIYCGNERGNEYCCEYCGAPKKSIDIKPYRKVLETEQEFEKELASKIMRNMESVFDIRKKKQIKVRDEYEQLAKATTETTLTSLEVAAETFDDYAKKRRGKGIVYNSKSWDVSRVLFSAITLMVLGMFIFGGPMQVLYNAYIPQVWNPTEQDEYQIEIEIFAVHASNHCVYDGPIWVLEDMGLEYHTIERVSTSQGLATLKSLWSVGDIITLVPGDEIYSFEYAYSEEIKAPPDDWPKSAPWMWRISFYIEGVTTS